MKSPIDRKGFTLLEVLIALAIMAVSLIAIYTAEGNSLLVSGTADRTTVASFLAQEQMVEWQIQLEQEINRNKFPDDREEAGVFEDPYSDYRYERRVRKVEIPFAAPDGEETGGLPIAALKVIQGALEEVSKSSREVTVRVIWGEGEDEEDYTLTTHIVKLQ